MFDVICVGSATVDVFAKTKNSELIKIMDNKGEEDLLAYPVGAKILLDDLDFTTGGGGTNVSVALSKLGHKVAYLGCIGKCANADMVISDLKKSKVDTSLIVRKEGKTGYSIVLDSIEHDRTILAFKGVNNAMDFSDIDVKKLKTKWFYFSAMLERSYQCLEEIAKYAEKNKIGIAFNPSSYLAEKGSEFLKPIISRITILVLNKEEAELIVGNGDMKYLATSLNRLGPKYVVITDGKNGAYCYHEGYLYFAKTNNVKVLETTGAGDAFASTFLSGIMQSKDVDSALRLATTNAESVISHYGAKNGLLRYNEALSLLKRRPVKITKKKVLEKLSAIKN